MALGVRLILVANAVAESKVRSHAPVILPIDADVGLRNVGQGIPLIDAELGSATAKQANAIVQRDGCSAVSLLRGGDPLLLHQHRAAITIETAEHDIGT